MKLKLTILFVLFLQISGATTSVTKLISTKSKLEIKFSINAITINDLKPFHVLIGLPNNDLPEINSHYSKNILFHYDAQPIETASIKWSQIQKLRGLWVGTLLINPGSNGKDNNRYFSEMNVSINFEGAAKNKSAPSNDKLLSNKIVNWEIAKHWVNIESKKIAKSINLPTGQWLKFEIENDGMYIISGADIANFIPNVDQFDTRSFSLFTGSNLGRYQSQAPGTAIPTENLVEVALQYIGATDGTFANEDSLIFFAQGASGFDLSGTNVTYNNNLYFTKNMYWLLVPDDINRRGLRVPEDQNTENPTTTFDYGLVFKHLETDLMNPQESGLGWVEQSISLNSSLEKSIELNNLSNNIIPKLKITFQGGTADKNARPTPLNKITLQMNTLQNPTASSMSWVGTNRRTTTIALSNNDLINGSNSFFFTNSSTDSYSNPFFDNLTLSFGRKLNFTGEAVEFYTPAHGTTINFNITSTNIAPAVWNITDASKPISIPIDGSSGNYSLSTSPEQNRYERLIMFDPNNLSSIDNLEIVDEQIFNKLRNTTIQAEHIIIAPREYESAASKLTKHRENSIFATWEDIYNEFSGGNTDPMAIRNFIDWTQNNWQIPHPSFVFLIGDADYDYRNITGKSDNIIPTVEVGVTNSYATDDRLATINGRIPEIALGRFPAQSFDEADNFIDKIIEFETNPEYRLWRQHVTLVADDGARPEKTPSELWVGKSHTQYSEILADLIPKSIEITKLYMLEFPEESDASAFGVSKPEATNALLDRVNKGTAIVNYIGHGSANQWAQEKLLFQDRGDLQAIDTGMKLPLWIAGTCSWGRFDDLNRESFSEELIRQPMNGASAVITTSQAIEVTQNQKYTERLFRNIFPDNKVSKQPIGIILQSIKTGNRDGEYFHLFGDPAMKLPLSSNEISITSVTPDTLKTLEESSFTANQSITQAGGEGFAILKDAEREVTREYNYSSNIESLTYKLPGSTLFRGKFSFEGSQISGKFRVPKDISFSDKPSTLKLYIISNDTETSEAIGAQDSLFIASGSTDADNFGPIINFETNDKRILRNGDHFNIDEMLKIRLTDPMGINLTGEIGHNIELTDLSNDEKKVITDDFIYDNNSITTGTIPVDLADNSDDIRLRVKAWDSANNPAESTIKLSVSTKSELKLYNVTNFPNPFSNTTQFTFEISKSAEINITIFTLGGRKIMQIEPEYFLAGYHTIDWNGKDAFGDNLANGVYLYRLQAKNDNDTASFIGRLAKYE